MNLSTKIQIQDLIYQLNSARNNPKSLIPYIQIQLNNFRNQRLLQISTNSFLKTFEGRKVWIEAIQFLKNQSETEHLIRHQGLDMATSDHAKDLAQNQAMGDVGSDGSILETRIKRYCILQKEQIGETVAHQYKKKTQNNARQTILSLIISDGDQSRKNRYSIFNPEFKYFGISFQQNTFSCITVINYSSHNLQTHPHINILKIKHNDNSKLQPSSIKKALSVIQFSQNTPTAKIHYLRKSKNQILKV